jgi:hypothetical protein
MRTHISREPIQSKEESKPSRMADVPVASKAEDLARALRYGPRLADIPLQSPEAPAVQMKDDAASAVEDVPTDGVVQRTAKGAAIGSAVGGVVLGGAAFLASGPVGWGITGGLALGAAVGHWLSGPGPLSGPPALSPAPAYDKSQGVQQRSLPRGTYLYHGTPWKKGDKQWWGKGQYPKNEGEDGGISYTLDPSATPKIRFKNCPVLVYRTTGVVPLTACPSKSQFLAQFGQRAAACYTPTEREVSFRKATMPGYLEYVGYYMHQAETLQV